MSSNKSLILIAFLILSLIASILLIFRTAIFSGKATFTNNSTIIALENSYLFASPLQAKADNKEQIRLTVFLLDGRGLGVSNKLVEIINPSNINIKNIQSTTDQTGKAIFDLSSLSNGTFEISAKTNNEILPQKVKLTFN